MPSPEDDLLALKKLDELLANEPVEMVGLPTRRVRSTIGVFANQREKSAALTRPD
jgi:hypothetical protein